MQRWAKVAIPLTFVLGAVASWGVYSGVESEEQRFYGELIGGLDGVKTIADPFERQRQLDRLRAIAQAGYQAAFERELAAEVARVRREIEASETARRDREALERELKAERELAERRRLEEELRQVEERLRREARQLADEAERRRAAEEAERQALEAARRQALLEAGRRLQHERVCRDDACTSWIFR